MNRLLKAQFGKGLLLVAIRPSSSQGLQNFARSLIAPFRLRDLPDLLRARSGRARNTSALPPVRPSPGRQLPPLHPDVVDYEEIPLSRHHDGPGGGDLESRAQFAVQSNGKEEEEEGGTRRLHYSAST